jgi:hypothetical protein
MQLNDPVSRSYVEWPEVPGIQGGESLHSGSDVLRNFVVGTVTWAAIDLVPGRIEEQTLRRDLRGPPERNSSIGPAGVAATNNHMGRAARACVNQDDINVADGAGTADY